MPIKTIEELTNISYPKTKIIKERMNKFIPGVLVPNIPKLNGMVSLYSGSGGSGKSNLLFHLFSQKNMCRNNFDNIYYFCPVSSFESIKKHPFKKHDKIYHSLSSSELETIYLIEFDTFWTTTGRRLVDRTIGRSLVAWLQLYSSRSRNLLQYNAS